MPSLHQNHVPEFWPFLTAWVYPALTFWICPLPYNQAAGSSARQHLITMGENVKVLVEPNYKYGFKFLCWLVSALNHEKTPPATHCYPFLILAFSFRF